jgi:hypothetical protein
MKKILTEILHIKYILDICTKVKKIGYHYERH